MSGTRRVFSSLDIIPDWANGHFIQWRIDPLFKGTRPYNFSLEISETPDFSELAAVKENLGDVFYCIDDTKLKQSWDSSYYYRVKLLTADGKQLQSQAVLFGSTRHSKRKYAMAAETIRKEILLCRMAGAEAWLLRRKSYGQQGTQTKQNVDPVTGVPITDTKGQDYGVGLDGGYFQPVPCCFFLQNAAQEKGLDPNGLGVREDIRLTARFPGYPLLDVRDVVCETKDGYRYSVEKVSQTSQPGSNITIFQVATLSLIPNTDTVYSIKLPVPGPKNL